LTGSLNCRNPPVENVGGLWMPSYFATLAPMGAELFLVGGAMALLMLGVFRQETEANAVKIGWLAIAVLLITAVFLLLKPVENVRLFDGAFVADPFARFMKLLVLLGGAGAMLLSLDPMREGRYLKFEYPVLLLLATAGMMMMISAGDLIALYIGLELQSLALYVMAAFRRDDVKSSEAGLKYFVLGALSSGMLLYGASLIYGFTGTTQFAEIARVAQAGAAQNVGLIFGLAFVFVGLAFKISAVPFHMWTPDVYEGAPTPVAAFFAAAPKVAAMALVLRVSIDAFGPIWPRWQQIVVFISIASMGLGAVAAIGQTNVKRLLAYSSIANMGFALVGLAAATEDGVQAVLVYMAVYTVMTLGAFACVLAMRTERGPVEAIDDLAGLAKTNGGLALALLIIMFSLAGIPPMAGFWGKYYVFLAAVNASLWPLAVLGVIASVVSCFYYIRIVKLMYFDEPKADVRFLPVQMKTAGVMATSAILLVLAFLPFPLRVGSTGDWLVGAARVAAAGMCAGDTQRTGAAALVKCQRVQR
jgi:NADH-quinone oxidoreductase subunit N